MKKIISMLLAIMMLFISFNAFATDSDMTEKVLLIVKEKIGITDDFESFESNIRQTKTSTIYNFYWNSDNKSLNISALENGFILDYYYYDGKSNYKDKPDLNRISMEEAKSRTKALIDKLNPSLKDSIRVISDGITQDLYSNRFSFKLERYENDIRVLNNNGYVTVNSDATQIISFNLSYDENLIFPSADRIISNADAKKLYNEKIGMVLEYRANYDYKKKERTITPVYIPKEASIYINAVSGETEEYKYDDENFRNDIAFSTAMKEEAAADGAGLSDAEKAEFENLKGLKTKEELIKIINENPYTKIADDMILSWYNTSKSAFDDTYKASFTYEKTKDGYKYTNVTLDMETGEILNFYKDEERDTEKKTTLTDSEIKAKKDSAVNLLAGKKATEYKYDEKSKNYIRYVNDIPFKTDSINIGISQITGEIRSYNISYTNVDFPSLSGVITASSATDGLFNQVSYNIAYSKMSSDNNAKLIYVLDENMPTTINAYSGKLLNAKNEEYISDVFTGYTDIEGHYAKDAVNTLAKFGIRFSENELKPNDAIKQKDYIALLVSTFKSRSPIVLKESEKYENEYSQALRQNIIMPQEENPDSYITREDSAKFMIRALDYEEIANISDIYICPFGDVTNFKGHISILSGLKIISGNGKGKFNPDNFLTRADAMIMIYNYLSR